MSVLCHHVEKNGPRSQNQTLAEEEEKDESERENGTPEFCSSAVRELAMSVDLEFCSLGTQTVTANTLAYY